MNTSLTPKKIALSAALTLGAFASGASAMTVHNYTSDPQLVSLMDNNGNVSQPVTISAAGVS